MLCLFAETIYGLRLGFIAEYKNSSHQAYLALSPWHSYHPRGLKLGRVLKQIFHPKTGDALGINPDKVWQRLKRLRKKRIEALSGEGTWQSAHYKNMQYQDEGPQVEKRRHNAYYGVNSEVITAENRAKQFLLRQSIELLPKPREWGRDCPSLYPEFYHDLAKE